MSAQPTAQEPAPAARFYNVKRFAAALGIGEMSVYRAIHEGHLPAVKFGGRYSIPATVLDELTARAMATGGLVDIETWRPGASVPTDGATT